jgi:hypothetical protein
MNSAWERGHLISHRLRLSVMGQLSSTFALSR